MLVLADYWLQQLDYGVGCVYFNSVDIAFLCF